MRWNRGLLLEGFSESAELLEQLCLVRVLTRMSLVVFDYPLLLHRAPSVLLACESGLSSTPIGVRPGCRSVSLGRLLAEGRPSLRANIGETVDPLGFSVQGGEAKAA